MKTLVELHGGNVEAKSEGLGLGSEFVVRLPISAQPSTPYLPEFARVRLVRCGMFRVLVLWQLHAADLLELLL